MSASLSDPQANTFQNTPSGDDLEARIKADEEARHIPDEPEVEAKPEAEPEAEVEDTEEPEVKPDESEYEKRLARMAFKEREARQHARQLEAEIARLRGTAPPLPKDEEFARQVKAEAAQQARQLAFVDKANAVMEDGKKAFPDFEAAVRTVNEISEVVTGSYLSNQVIEAAMEAGDPHKIIHYLSKNPDEAERIIGLSPHAMGVAMARVSAKLVAPAPKQQSKAPPPIKPVGGKAKVEVSDEDVSIEEYMRRHDERMRSGKVRY